MAHQVKRGFEGGGWYVGKYQGSDEEEEARIQARKGLEALGEYETKLTGRVGDLSDYYGGAEGRVGEEYGLKRDEVGLAREQIGVQREGVGVQESTALTSFLGDAYSFRSKADVGRATGGLAFSGGQERGIERQRATMSDLMQGRQEQFDIARKGLDISGKGLDIKMEQLDLSETGDLADLARQHDIDLSSIEDMLYQIETERISYEGIEGV